MERREFSRAESRFGRHEMFSEEISVLDHRPLKRLENDTAFLQVFGNDIALDQLIERDVVSEDLKKRGVIFQPLERAMVEHADLFRKHFMSTEAALGSAKFAALHRSEERR